MSNYECPIRKEAFFVDELTRRLMKVDACTGEKKEMTEEECHKKFKQHEGCGGWIIPMISSKDFKIQNTCTKCDKHVSRHKGCDICSD